MTRVLLVEDSATQAMVIRIQLRLAGFDADVASDGLEALRALEMAQPDLVVTDLHMPEMDGVQLVAAIRRQYPTLPVVLTTTHGSEQMTREALKCGAISYVPKAKLEQHLGTTLRQVLDIAGVQHDESRLRQSLAAGESGFRLRSDPAVIPLLIAYAKEELIRRQFSDPTGTLQIAVALKEALELAIYRGSLEVGVDLCEGDPAACERLAQQRRDEQPYRDRQVHFAANVSLAKSVFTIRHEGPSIADLAQTALDLDSIRGRSGLLIRTFFDEVLHNAGQRELTVVKRRVFDE